MSRTDKTAPHTVRVFYYSHWLQEYHDHREGPCDLSARPRNAKEFERTFRLHYGGRRDEDQTHCYWVASYESFWSHPLSRCACPICKRYAYGEPPSQVERREGKRLVKGGWEKEY